jgi:hypothetical protein
MGQALTQLISKPVPMQETGEGAESRMRGNSLVGEADSDCFLPVMSINKTGHCSGSRYVGVFGCSFHDKA